MMQFTRIWCFTSIAESDFVSAITPALAAP